MVICEWQNLIQDKNVDTSFLRFECLPGHKNFSTVHAMMLLLLPPQKFAYPPRCVLVVDNQKVWSWGRLQNRKSGTGKCLNLHSPVVSVRTASLTFNKSTFCPHSVFMCFVWIWEQTAIISLYSITGCPVSCRYTVLSAR
jgi:hypothetical protein